MAERITDIYISLLLCPFVLTVPLRDGYLTMVEWKYGAFLVLSGGYLLAMAVWWVRSLCRGERCPLHLTLPRAAILAYLGFSCLSALLSPWRDPVLVGGTRREGLISILLYGLTFLCLGCHLRPRRWMLRLYGAAMTVFCIIAIIQFCGGNPFRLYPQGLNWFGRDIDYPGSYFGTCGNADISAALTASGAAVFAVGALRPKEKWDRLLAVPAALCLLVTAWAGVAAGLTGIVCGVLLALPALYDGKARMRLALVSGGLALAGLLALLFWPFGGTVGEISAALRGNWSDGLGSGRGYIWRECWRLFWERPIFGGGPDTLSRRGILPFSWLTPDGRLMESVITSAHNEYLNILVCQGILALLCWLALLAGACIAWFRRAPDRREAAAWGAGAAVWAVQAFFGIGICITAPVLFFMLAVLTTGKKEESP